MRRLRFSIASLLALVLFVAIAVAALRAGSDEWDSGLFGGTLLVLLTGLLLAVHRTERRRAFWLGFSLFGCAYLAASLIPPIESRLPTTRGLAYLDSKVPGRQRSFAFQVTTTGPGVGSTTSANAVYAVAFAPNGKALANVQGGVVRLWNATTGKVLNGAGGTTENFLRIGHCLLVLVFGFGGGKLSKLLFVPGRLSSMSEPQDTLPDDQATAA